MNFLDYMKKYGKRPFTKFKFNELDGIVFVALSYIRFEEVFKKNYISMKDIIVKFALFDKEKRKKYYMFDQDEKYLAVLSRSKRYYNLDVIDKLTYFNKKATTQFFAYAVRLNDCEIAITYRGTDQTILGWHEALRLGYDDYVGGQKRSKDFLAYMIKKYPRDKFYVMGHSKGGNYAVYAASSIDKKLQKNIVKVYNYDGPTLLDKTKAKTNYNNIRKRIITFLPSDSVVGIALGEVENSIIVESKFTSFAQHVYYFWKVVGTHFKKGKRTIASTAFARTFPEWLSSMTEKQMKTYIDILFIWLKKAQINKVADFIDIGKINKLISVINSEKSKEKKAFGDQILNFFTTYLFAFFTKHVV